MRRLVTSPWSAGGLYLTVMRAMLEGFQRMGCVLPDARITTINGPIGRMRQDLRKWLHEANPRSGGTP